MSSVLMWGAWAHAWCKRRAVVYERARAVCVCRCVCVCVWTLATCVRVCCEWLLSVRAAVRVPVRPPALARIPIEAASASQCRGVHRRGPQAGAERLRGVQVSVTVDSVAAGASGLEASVTAEGEAGRTN